MNISLKQLIPALESVGVDAGHIEATIAELKILLAELDRVEVKGRDNVDTMLGCMMVIEQIIGEGGDKNG